MKPERTADCVVVGVRWKSKPTKIATLLLGLYDDDGEIDYVGSAAVAASKHDAIAEQVLPLLDEASDRRFSEPNRWGGSGLEEQPLRPELVAEVRYDKVQGNAVPARHEAAALPAGQGSGAVHVGASCGRRASRRADGRGSARARDSTRGRGEAVTSPLLLLLRARRLHARRLARHLGEVRRVRRLPDARRLVALDPLEQHAQVADGVVDRGLHVAELREARAASRRA